MDPQVPVVNVGSRTKPSYLPAEACLVLPGQPSGKKLSPEQTRFMIEFACRKPKFNADSIVEEGRKVLGLTPPGNAVLVSPLCIPWILLANLPLRHALVCQSARHSSLYLPECFSLQK
jgi:hypothetical protein